VDGLRRTDAETFEVVEMVLCGKVNKEIVKIINQQGGVAVGLSGKDGNLVRAKKYIHEKETQEDGEVLDLGLVGAVDLIDTTLVKHLVREDYIPVIAPIGYGMGNFDYNINADIFAGELARALGAEKLVYLTDVDGILRDPEDSRSRIGALSVKEASLSLNDFATGGMMPKAHSAVKAVEGGVCSAHIVNGTVRHSLLDVVSDNPLSGTTITLQGGCHGE
jgi:acetylglutamate kinase